MLQSTPDRVLRSTLELFRIQSTLKCSRDLQRASKGSRMLLEDSKMLHRRAPGCSELCNVPLYSFITAGLVPLMGHMMRIGVSSFFSFYPPPLDAKDPCEYSKFGGVHGIQDLEHMKIAMAKAEEAVVKNITCPVTPRCLAMVEGKCLLFSKDEKIKIIKRWP